MIIEEMNEGGKIAYEVENTSICFADDLTINLARRQKDYPVSIDICSDSDGALVIGTITGLYYVAQIMVPAKEYNGQDPLPLSMEQVTLNLWALENR